jgi:heat shock protein HslJ
MKLTRLAFITLSFLIFTSGCFAQTSPAGREWSLVYLRGTSLGNTNPFLKFNDTSDRFYGNTGCNIMNGSSVVRGNTVSFSAVITTKRACARKPAEVESAVLSMLGRVDRFRVSKSTLSLFSGNRLLAQFVRQRKGANGDEEAKPVADNLTLEERKWTLVSIGNSPISKIKEEAFISFDAVKGSAGGSTSCNAFGGSYTTDGDKIKITEIISTMRACVEDERMDIERIFLSGLREADRYEIQADKLTLYRGKKLLLTFVGKEKSVTQISNPKL